MHDFFNSHQGSLRSDLDGYELPEEIQTAISACDQSLRMDDLDRLLIYADGSSMGCAKHTAPQRAEEEGVGDTWAYVVLGERYQPPGLRFIGWSAHPVIYEEGHNYHLVPSGLVQTLQRGKPHLGSPLAAQSKLGHSNLLPVGLQSFLRPGGRHNWIGSDR